MGTVPGGLEKCHCQQFMYKFIVHVRISERPDIGRAPCTPPEVCGFPPPEGAIKVGSTAATQLICVLDPTGLFCHLLVDCFVILLLDCFVILLSLQSGDVIAWSIGSRYFAYSSLGRIDFDQLDWRSGNSSHIARLECQIAKD